MKTFASLFTQDASYVTSSGLWLRGRQAIEQELSYRHEGASVEIAGVWIRFVKPDVAVVHTTWEEDLDSRSGIIIQVLTCEDGQWRIAALQNTDIVAGDVSNRA